MSHQVKPSERYTARAVYRALGFAWWDTDVMFLRGDDRP